MFVATINKTLKSYFFAIIGAEYVLRWLPIGTHEWEKFVKPEDLKKILTKYDLSLNKLEGMNFNIIKDEWSISKDLSVNYMARYSEPYTSLQHFLLTEYKWDDNLKFMFEAFYTQANDKRSPLNIYDGQNQVVFKVQYQF